MNVKFMKPAVMKKHFSSLLAAAFLLSGCSWLSALNPWAEEKPAAETREVVPEARGVNRYLWQCLKNVKNAIA